MQSTCRIVITRWAGIQDYYNHRESDDVDIFFLNHQFIPFLSPRINDTYDDDLSFYAEQRNFLKLNFPVGDVNFIFSEKITDFKPEKIELLGEQVFIEHPLEIIAKKIYYSYSSIAVMDLFDIAIAYTKEKKQYN